MSKEIGSCNIFDYTCQEKGYSNMLSSMSEQDESLKMLDHEHRESETAL